MLRKEKSKGRKVDRLFVLVSALVVANLSYWLIKNIWRTIESRLFNCAWCWGLIAVNILAIIGMLWLVQNDRKRRRLEKAEHTKLEEAWEEEIKGKPENES